RSLSAAVAGPHDPEPPPVCRDGALANLTFRRSVCRSRSVGRAKAFAPHMKNLSWFVLLFSAFAFAARAAETPAADPAAVDGFKFVKTVGAISEYTLENNGLTVLLMPEHSAPVLT